MATFQELAEQLSRAFERKTRDNGDTYSKLKDDSPEWMSDVMYKAHGDMLPDDFRYQFIEAAADHFAEDDADPDEFGEAVDSAVPVYNADRLRWVASNLNRAYYVNDAVDEFGIDSKGFDLFQALGVGMYAEISEVFSQVAEALQELVEEEENPE